MRICFDLDGVICHIKKPNEHYSDVLPLDGAVEKIRMLRQNGHYIIIHTARHMKTTEGNVAKAIAKIGKVTLDWLERHGVEYDEIIFGKPWANVYVDDNAMRFTSWEMIGNNAENLPISNEESVRKTEAQTVQHVEK